MLKILKKIVPQNLKNKLKIKKFINEFNKYEVICKKNRQNKYILFGTPKHGNIGDHAITIAIYEFFKDLGKEIFEVSSFDRYYLLEYIKNSINTKDVILVNGGGFMGSQWIEEEKMIRDVVSSFPNNKIVIFPQTVYYKDDEEGKNEFATSLKIYSNHKDLTICTREKKSYDFVNKNMKGVKVVFVPDIVLYLNQFRFNEKRENALLCLRNDPEKSVKNADVEKVENILKDNKLEVFYTDTVINNLILKNDRYNIFENKLREFSKYKIVVTDRLHGMIFAALTNTPCIVFGNYNYKVKGVYEWIKDVPFIKFVENSVNIEEIVEKLINYDTNLNCKDLINKEDSFKELIDLFKEI